MTECLVIDGLDVIYRRAIIGYVAVVGPGYVVHVTQPGGRGKWFARRPYALEPICSADTVAGCIRLAKKRYDAQADERRAAIQRRLSAAGNY